MNPSIAARISLIVLPEGGFELGVQYSDGSGDIFRVAKRFEVFTRLARIAKTALDQHEKGHA